MTGSGPTSRNARVVAVAGATGRQGGAVARRLRRDGWTVHGLTRDTGSAAARVLAGEGIVPVACDLGDPTSTRTALAGADRLFLTTTPYEHGVEAEERQALTAIDAARDAGLRQIVYASVASADRPTGVPHFESKGRIERALAASGIARYAIIRPALFMEMFLGAPFRRALGAGRIALALAPGTPIALTATADIAAFAARALAMPDHFHGAAIDLAGDQPTVAELVAGFARGLGRPIRYERVAEAASDPAMRPTLGTQRWLMADGWRIDVAALRAQWDVPLTDLAAWIADHEDELLRERVDG